MLACSLAKNVLVPASRRPISASVLIIAGRLNLTSSVVFTSPALVLVPSRTAHSITPAALIVRNQPHRSARQGQAGCRSSPSASERRRAERTAQRALAASMLDDGQIPSGFQTEAILRRLTAPPRYRPPPQFTGLALDLTAGKRELRREPAQAWPPAANSAHSARPVCRSAPDPRLVCVPRRPQEISARLAGWRALPVPFQQC